MLEVTKTKSGDVDQANIELLGFEPATFDENGDVETWVGVGRVKIIEGGNIVSVERRFTNIPAGVVTWLNATGAPMLCTAMESAI